MLFIPREVSRRVNLIFSDSKVFPRRHIRCIISLEMIPVKFFHLHVTPTFANLINDSEQPSAVYLGRPLTQPLMRMFLQIPIECIFLSAASTLIKNYRHPVFHRGIYPTILPSSSHSYQLF